MLLTLFTNNPVLAANADDAGIDRIGVDLERIGKHKRQDHLKTWISDHKIEDIKKISPKIKNAKLFARTNPIHDGIDSEINTLINIGVKVLMLPYFHHLEEAKKFINIINNRAEVSLLVETAASAKLLPELIKLNGVNDIHIGLNDLHLSLKLPSHFHLLQSDYMKQLTSILRKSGKTFGFGGIGRADDCSLPIPSDLVYAQYAYHKAKSALVSRVFTNKELNNTEMKNEVQKARERFNFWFSTSKEELDRQHKLLSTLLNKR